MRLHCCNLTDMLPLKLFLSFWVLHCSRAVSNSLDERDLNDIICWETKGGYMKELPETAPVRSQSVCSANNSKFGILPRNYYKLSMSGRGHVKLQPKVKSTGFTPTDDYSFLTLVKNDTNPTDISMDAFYFEPTLDCEWYTLHNRYTDLYNGYATVLEGVFENYTMVIMKHHLNTSTEKEWITPKYLWKLVAMDGKYKNFRLVSKAFPGDFVTWTYREYDKKEHYWQIERSNDSEYRKKYSFGKEWWGDTLFNLKLLSTPALVCAEDFNFDQNKVNQNAASETMLKSVSLCFTGVFLMLMHAMCKYFISHVDI